MTLLALVSQTVVSMATGVRSPSPSPSPVHRIRTVLLNSDSGTLSVDEHVRVRLSAQELPAQEPSAQELSVQERWPVFGDVLIEYGVGASQAAQLAASHPGALVVAVHHGPRCWIRLGPAGHVLELEAGGSRQAEGVWETAASLAHSCLVAGLPAAALGSAAVCVLRTQVPGSPLSSCRSRCRVASASSDRDLPTEE